MIETAAKAPCLTQGAFLYIRDADASELALSSQTVKKYILLELPIERYNSTQTNGPNRMNGGLFYWGESQHCCVGKSFNRTRQLTS